MGVQHTGADFVLEAGLRLRVRGREGAWERAWGRGGEDQSEYFTASHTAHGCGKAEWSVIVMESASMVWSEIGDGTALSSLHAQQDRAMGKQMEAQQIEAKPQSHATRVPSALGPLGDLHRVNIAGVSLEAQTPQRAVKYR